MESEIEQVSPASLLEVRNLRVSYVKRRSETKAVDGVSFKLSKGESLGIVGESGCGKSTLGSSLMRIVDPPGRIMGGEILLSGKDIVSMNDRDLRRIRGSRIGMIFQDPMASLNPMMKIGDHFVEEILTHDPRCDKKMAWKRTEEFVKNLGLSSDRLRDYPHQFSGGMRQRIMIGLALILKPELLIADEPTTALDVIVEAQILDLMSKLKRELNLSIILITHNLGIVAEITSKIAIMYAGRIVELADSRTIFKNPLFPYTQLLLKLVPNILLETSSLNWIPGSPPPLDAEIMGCAFRARCAFAFEKCKNETPVLSEIELGHFVACHLYTTS